MILFLYYTRPEYLHLALYPLTLLASLSKIYIYNTRSKTVRPSKQATQSSYTQ